MSSNIDPAKLKVVELRAELSSRGLDSKGNKPVLVQRLKEALEKESSQGDNSVDDTNEDNNLNKEDVKEEPSVITETKVNEVTEVQEEVKDEKPTPVIESVPEVKPQEDSVVKTEEKLEIVQQEDVIEQKNGELTKEDQAPAGDVQEEEQMDVSQDENLQVQNDEPTTEGEEKEKESVPEISKEVVPTVSNDSRGEKRKRSPSPSRTQNKISKPSIKEDEPEIDNDKVQLSWYDSDLHLQVNKETFLSAKPYHDGVFGYVWAGVRATHGITFGKVRYEVKINEELKWEDVIKRPEKKGSHKRQTVKEQKNDDNVKPETEKEKAVVDNENDAAEKVQDDVLATDAEKPEETIPVVESKDAMETENTDTVEESTDKGEVAKDETEVTEEIVPHLIRIGWSLSSSDLQLGESEHSFGYESSGKFVSNGTFTDYGASFKVGDVIGAYLNMDNEKVSVFYTINGQLQPEALSFPKSDLLDENCAFFPHILSRNYSFELNLGNRDDAWFPDVGGEYMFLDKFENKVAGPARPSSRSECEVIMMCGLPASGKTHWIHNYLKENSDKKYTVLGNSFLLSKMTVNGYPLYNNYKNCWNDVLDKLRKCVNKLIEIASLRRRNYILDQTNIYPTIQRRKMRSFEGFKRRAVVVVVSDEEQSNRLKKQKEEGIETTEGKLLEMKACMNIPSTGDLLDEVIYAELGEEEAKAVVQKYNVQGKEAGYGPGNQNQIKSRHQNRNRWQNKRDSRGGKHRDQRNSRNNRFDRNNSQGRHGYWQGRSSGSWSNRDRRDNRNNRDYRNNRGGASSRYQDRGRQDSRKNNYNNRRSSFPPNRNQGGAWQSGSGGNWGPNQGSWSGQAWQNWNQAQGNWNPQSHNQYKPYNQQGYNQQPQGYGYNWNYYGPYGQNWNSQGQPNHSNSSQTSGQYNNQMTTQQQAWAQYTQQYNTQESVQK